MTRPYFIVEKWNVLTSARAPKRAHLRMQFVFLALILQIGRCHNTCNILPPINSLRLSLSLSIRRPRLDMCLLAPLKSHLSTKGHKDGCYNGKCMFCAAAVAAAHLLLRSIGQWQCSGSVGNIICRTLFTEQRYRFSRPLHATTHNACMGYKRDIGVGGNLGRDFVRSKFCYKI